MVHFPGPPSMDGRVASWPRGSQEGSEAAEGRRLLAALLQGGPRSRQIQPKSEACTIAGNMQESTSQNAVPDVTGEERMNRRG